MKTLKQLITARRVSLCLIILLAALMYTSTFIPQEIDATPATIEAWRQAHEWLLWPVDAVNLHRIYSQPWFSVTILLAALSLAASSFDQLTSARRKLASTSIASGEMVAESVPEQHFSAVAQSHGYRLIRSISHEHLKFVRNPWGYFGVMMLHIGMTLTIAVSLYVSLTGRQGAVILVEGEIRDHQKPWDGSEYGMLSSPLTLPGSIQLNKVRVGFDDKNQPTDVMSDISIADQTGKTESLTTSINRISSYRGLRIYHASQYGDAFTVTFTDKSGTEHTEKISAQQPVSLEKAGYSSDFKVAWSPYQFGVKYFADADKKSMSSGNPQLVVRMLAGEKEIARTALTIGSSGTLGEYRTQFVKAEKWAKFIIVDINGMSAIFAGFAIVMLGGLIHYMTPPRALIGIRQSDGAYRVYWKAIVFTDFYWDERDDIAQELNQEMTS